MAKPKGINWPAVRADYITGDMTCSQLAAKYGVALRKLQEHSRSEKWSESRKEYRKSVADKCIQAAEAASVKRAERIYKLADALLDKLEVAIGELNQQLAKETVRERDIIYGNKKNPTLRTKETVKETETITAYRTIIDRHGLKEISSALRDLKDVQLIRSVLDDNEQRARIDKINADIARGNEENKEIKVEFVGIPEEYTS